MTQLLDEAADALERRLFFDQMTERFDALRQDEAAWAEIETERAVEHGAAGDQS
jgi:hypothetical protein